MARINAKQGFQLALQLGTVSGNSITYANTILVNTNRSFKIEAETESGEQIDLADLSAPAVMKQFVKSKSWSFDGSGTYDQTAALAFAEWVDSGVEKPVKVSAPGITVTGNAVCTSVGFSADRVTHIESEMTVISSGEFTIT